MSPSRQTIRSRAVLAGCALALLAAGGCLPRQGPMAPPGTAPSITTRRAESLSREAAGACPVVTPQELYRFVAGVDSCLTPMTSGEIGGLRDPLGLMLARNQNGAGPWPSRVAEVVTAVQQGIPGLRRASYVVGEGSQVPAAVTSRANNRNLRYVITWQNGSTPSIYLSSRPDATSPIFMEMIGWDPVKRAFNYYRYISNSEVVDDDPDDVRTWTYAGDTASSRSSASAGRGCFSCHRNGGLNMKELKAPWNNWHSQLALIRAGNVPTGVASDPLFREASNAESFERDVFRPVMQALMVERVRSSIDSSTRQVTDPASLLRHLMTNTTVNFTSSQVVARSAAPPLNIPPTFVINDDLLGSGGLNLGYANQLLTLPVPDYRRLVASHRLVNGVNSRRPEYAWPGDNFFAVFYPEPAFEDVAAVQELWRQMVISPELAAAVLMVDFPNPVFSPSRDALWKYAEQITTGVADGEDIPHQLAELVREAAASQPPCTHPDRTKCSPEQQFVFYWEITRQPDWRQRLAAILNPYLAAVAQRMSSAPEDSLTLARSRQEQFQNYPGICNLYEFDLMLPCSEHSGTGWYQMNSEGTLSPQPQSVCPTRPPGWRDPCKALADS